MKQLMLYLWICAHAISGAIAGVLLLNPLTAMLRGAGAVKSNFRQREVVNLAGLLIILAWVLLGSAAAIFPLVVDALGIFVPQGFVLGTDILLPLTILILGAGLFGLLDDLLGSREHSGFKGHIGALLKGKLTTGALKAIGIPVVAVVASSLLSSGTAGIFAGTPFVVVDVFANALLIALFVNTFNLLDLRPGRALKVYIPLQLLFIVVAGSALGTTSAALAGIALVLIGPDLKEKIMLGDTGSNILGGAIGFCFVATFGWPIKLPAILILVVLQVLTEKYSLSAIIERTPFLRVFDNLGREPE